MRHAFDLDHREGGFRKTERKKATREKKETEHKPSLTIAKVKELSREHQVWGKKATLEIDSASQGGRRKIRLLQAGTHGKRPTK